MSGPGDFDHLSRFKVSSDKTSPFQQWGEVDDGSGLPLAAIKFACHSAAGITKKGFMRIYIQIPIIGSAQESYRTEV
ncbi:hypothetical protein N7536_005459 [Penicillium majusculum]|nr:hypothetical protein N7536_005459 [Penicillium majusculum]